MQHECIPQAILGMDVVCQAKSGMGKTAVFVLATLQQLEPVESQVGISVKCFHYILHCLHFNKNKWNLESEKTENHVHTHICSKRVV